MPNKKPKHAHPGQPRKYQTIEELQTAVDSYFETTQKLTITGLALHLGFTSRLSLINNENYSSDFFYSLKRAKLKIEQYYEEKLTGHNAAGVIFALKNFDWRDRRENVFSGGLTFTQALDGATDDK